MAELLRVPLVLDSDLDWIIPGKEKGSCEAYFCEHGNMIKNIDGLSEDMPVGSRLDMVIHDRRSANRFEIAVEQDKYSEFLDLLFKDVVTCGRETTWRTEPEVLDYIYERIKISYGDVFWVEFEKD